MTTRLGSIAFSVVVLTLALVSSSTTYAQVECAWAQPDDNLFPSLVIAASTIRPERIKALQAASVQQDRIRSQKDNSSAQIEKLLQEFLGVTIKTSKPHTRVRLIIAATRFFDESSCDEVLTENGRSYQVYPTMKWNYKILGENDQQIPLSVVFKVRIDDDAEKEIVKTITVRSIRDCPLGWSNQFSGSGPENVQWMVAAYVNEDHPWIDLLLRESLEQGIVDSFNGQHSGPEHTMQQVFAIWQTLQRRGFRYSSIEVTPGAGGKVFSQTVRPFEDSLSTAQGNCIDGTAVFASLLRKINIEPYIAIVPGHAFLAFRVENGNEFKIYGLETTMIGHTDIRSEPDQAKMNYMSATSFCAAIQAGSKEFADAAKITGDGKPHPDYLLLPLSAMRSLGIAPLPSRVTRELGLPTIPDKIARKKNPNAIPKIGVTGGIKFSVVASHRAAMTGPGLVLSLRNGAPLDIQATVLKLDAEGHPIKSATIVLPANGIGEIGHLQGIVWALGDQVAVVAPGFEPLRLNIGQ
ncbi:MAG: hypothetical protein K8S99_04145 [Planctomycetes bacterium]|nr:hypothetical protein [Planctomycetota bacterium]